MHQIKVMFTISLYVQYFFLFFMDMYYNILTKKDKLSFLLLSRKIKLNKLKTQKKKKSEDK